MEKAKKDAMAEVISKLIAVWKVTFPTGASKGLLPQIAKASPSNDCLRYALAAQAMEIDGVTVHTKAED